MFQFVTSRLLTATLVVFGVVGVVFLFIHMIPGDPVEVMLGEAASPADREALRRALGLDQPLLEQWQDYMCRLVQLDLGTSLHSGQAITHILSERIPATLALTASGLTVAILIAFPLGIIAAVRRDTRWDQGAMAFAMLGIAIPNFWLGPLLILVFSVGLGWFPVSGMAGLGSLMLPSLTLGTALAAILSRMVRATLVEILHEDYIRTARAKGLDEPAVIGRHALKNAMLPLITVLGLQLGALLGGAVITETVFGWPGLGQLTVEAIQRRDYPVVQACVLLISLTYVVVNTLSDLAYGWLDPRVRLHS
ncbi:MAG TPA: nickel ABC transporter permease [Gammaproteobacteria bacterium]|nr:nickel ABC transporter permease [Gammaproteobacteria bacterium]